MSDVINEVQGTAVEEAVQCALLFELENIPVPGRKVMYDVLKSVLSDKGIDLRPCCFPVTACMHLLRCFCRSCLRPWAKRVRRMRSCCLILHKA